MAEPLIDRILRKQGWLEPVADVLQGTVGGFYRVLGPPGRVLKTMLHGTVPLGHPLHPAITDIPIGAWTVGFVLDWLFLANDKVPVTAGDTALVVGLIGGLLSALTGYTDFHETYGHERRAATAHGLTMTVAVTLMAVSLVFRLAGSGDDIQMTAVVLSTIGLAIVLVGGYLGGHITFGMGTMVNRSAFLNAPEDFVAIGSSTDFHEGEPKLADADGFPVLAVRHNGQLCAISNTCSHAGGPLNEGTFEGDTVVCPWHASRFKITDGTVKGGPATFSQPAMVVREQNGVVEVKPAAPLH